jgi:replicative DNA helicase
MPRLVRTLTPEEEAEADLSQALFYQRMKERAFLCYLLARPSEMERFMGNVAMNEFFVEGRNCCIFECMEQVYLKHGTIAPREYPRLVAEELIARDLYESVGGRKYLIALVFQTDFAPQFVWEFQR